MNEAMACGTATIVSDQVGCAADLVDRTNGRIVKAGDTAALSKALVECLENSDEMGKASHRKIAGWGYDQDVGGLETAIAKAVTLK